MTFYDLTAKDIRGNEFRFAELKGKTVLIVNTASRCGFTPQYDGLQRIYEKYREQGFIVLGFPSNDFLFQEPAQNDAIENFCKINFGVTFPLFEKIHVRGKNCHPVYRYLTAGDGKKEFKGFIKWNFTKFLIDPNGSIIARFSPFAKPEKIGKLLADKLIS